jgi:hypothetical protein
MHEIRIKIKDRINAGIKTEKWYDSATTNEYSTVRISRILGSSL